MRVSTRYFSSTALVLALASPAYADITADDAWMALRANMDAIGGELNVTKAQNGDSLTITDTTWAFDLPFDGGRVEIGMADTTFTENGDGTVTLTYPNPASYSVRVSPKDKEPFSATVDLAFENSVMTANGTPQDVIFDFAMDRMTMALSQIDFEDKNDAEIDMTGTLDAYKGQMRVEIGSQVHTSLWGETGPQDVKFTMNGTGGETPGSMEQSSGHESSRSEMTMVLPKGGMAFTNLAASLAQGMTMDVKATLAGYFNNQTMQANGQIVSQQDQKSETYNIQMGLGGDGIKMVGDATGIDGTVTMPQVFPLPITYAAESAGGELSAPVSAGEAIQDASVVMNLNGVTLAETLWSMVDPNQALPRDPMTISLDMDAKVRNLIDWFNFTEVAKLDEASAPPAELHGLTLNALKVDMVGATLTGEGQMNFDNSDMETFGGFPAPSGTVDLALQGGNGLMDKLVEMGLLPEQQAMSARMMIGMFAKPDPDAGEDALKSTLEITPSGEVLANGMRIR
ncbi:MAG: DUF2125 domain-containing protein [Pseudomonadota bacterium]|nr:DUF2125 domain-containing protein [Pseudomonadota bacterium]